MSINKVPPPPPTKAPITLIEWESFSLPGINVPLRRVKGTRRNGVPVVDEGYQFREDLVREVAWAVWPHDDGDPTPCLLVGPKGCGKTSLIVQLAAHCNVVVYRTNLNVGTTVRHLLGRVGAEEGRTVYVPGIVTQCAEEGAWLLLDEITGATPPVALALFPVLEARGAIRLEEEQPPRYIRRHQDFRVFATDNTIGAEQEESRFNYSGTNPDMNEALLDRFGSTVQVGYLEPEQEHAAVKAIVENIEDMDLIGIIRVAKSIRESGAGFAFSTRMVIEWARRIAAGYAFADGTVKPYTNDDILKAAFPAFLAKIRSKVERDSVAEVIRRVFAMAAG